MPPVFGPVSPSPTRLWSCAVPISMAVWPSQIANRLASSPTRKASTTTSAPASPKRALETIVNRLAGVFHRFSHHDPLAGSEAIRLDDDRSALTADILFRLGRIVEALIGGGGNVEFSAEILGETLRPFQLRGIGGRPESGNASCLQRIDKAVHQRLFRPDNDEADLLVATEGNGRVIVIDIKADEGGEVANPGIARRAKERVAMQRPGQLPGQRMLAPARSDEEYVHEFALCPA